MARVELTVQDIVRAGVNPTFSAADAVNHHSFDNTGERVFLAVKNASGGSINVVVDVAKTVDGLAVSDLTVAVPAANTRFIGPFPSLIYGQADAPNGLTNAILFSVSSATSVTLAAVKLPQPTY